MAEAAAWDRRQEGREPGHESLRLGSDRPGGHRAPAGQRRGRPVGRPAVQAWREEADGLILRGTTWVTADDIARTKKLRVISKQGAGVDRIDLKAARAKGIVVMNTPGVNAEAVAELIVGLVLAMARRIAVADRRLRAGDKINASSSSAAA